MFAVMENAVNETTGVAQTLDVRHAVTLSDLSRVQLRSDAPDSVQVS